MATITINHRIVSSWDLFEFAEATGMDRGEALGRLVMLWLWAAEQEDNDISGHSPKHIAQIMGWDKDPDDLWEALSETGLVEHAEDGSFTIKCRGSDWHPNAPESAE